MDGYLKGWSSHMESTYRHLSAMVDVKLHNPSANIIDAYW